MNQFTNNAGFGLSMAVWLAYDEYTDGGDRHPGQNVISATALLKPTRQIVLTPRVPVEDQILDLADRIASCRGNAIHDSIEKAWKNSAQVLSKLGYPKKMIEKVRVNPEEGTLKDGEIPVYLEQRAFRTIMVDGVEIVISGKFDQVVNGELNDTKTTSTFAWTSHNKDEDYRTQLSIYRWLNPKIVTSNLARIQFFFTDWQGFKTKIEKDYPPYAIMERTLELMSERETETWITSKIREILLNQNREEPDVVRCTPTELWMSDPVFKYYADPAKASAGGRSTKNFPNYPAAAAHRSKAGKGVIVEVPAQPKACGYCPAFPVCTQRLEYGFE